jgi:hypothetical protein
MAARVATDSIENARLLGEDVLNAPEAAGR